MRRSAFNVDDNNRFMSGGHDAAIALGGLEHGDAGLSRRRLGRLLRFFFLRGWRVSIASFVVLRPSIGAARRLLSSTCDGRARGTVSGVSVALIILVLPLGKLYVRGRLREEFGQRVVASVDKSCAELWPTLM